MQTKHYEVEVFYKTASQGNWTSNKPGWKVVRENLTLEEAEEALAFFKDIRHAQQGACVYTNFRIIEVSRRVVGG